MFTPDEVGFPAWLLKHDRRNTTIRKHTYTLRYLGKFVDEFDKEKIDRFLLGLKADGKSNAYLNTIINTIRLYSQYLGLDPALQHYKQFKKTSGIKATMSDDEIEAFLGLTCPYHADKEHWRQYTIFWSICAYTGMRPGEVAHLKIEDVDFGRGVFQIRISKTNQPGISPIPPNIKDLIKSHLDTLQGEYLFPSKQGGTHYSAGEEAVFDNVDWHYDWKKRLKILGIKRQRLTPYSFRHSFATRLLEENVSLFHVKKLMRHNDLKSTLVYEHLTTKDLIQAVERLPLIRKGTTPKTILQHIAELVKSFHIEQDTRFAYSIEENDCSVRFEVHLKSLK